MRFIKHRRANSIEPHDDHDPMASLANLFDVGLVFIVGLLLAFFQAYRMQDLLNEKTNVTILKQSEDKKMEIITKKGNEIKVRKVSREQTSGKGKRLGVAYQLEDGTCVYVPE